MAIQKNFVVRNGLEVATDLILADAITGKVGIASTGPRTELDVRGGIAATDLTIVGVATINTLKVATGIITDLQGTNLNYSGVSTITNAGITNLNVSGIATATLLNVTNNAIIAVGIVTHLSGTNLNYSGIGTIENLNSTNLIISGFSTFNSYADFNGGIVADQLSVSGVSTLSTVDINAGDIEVTSVRTSNFSATGVSTIASLSVTGSTFNTLTVNNFSTLNGVTTVTNANITNLNVTGIATISTVDINAGDIEVTSVRTSNLNATGVSTLTNLGGTNLNYSGIGTVVNLRSTNFNNTGIGTVVNLRSTNFNNTGIGTIVSLNSTSGTITNLTGTAATIGSVRILSGIITASSGIVTYYGDGAYLQNISAGIGIGTTGGLVGYAVTFINFYGTGVSTALYDSSAGIATIFFEGGGSGTIGIGTEFPPSLNSNGDLFYNANYGRLFVYYDESVIGVGTDAFWVDAAPFNVGIITSLTNVSFAPGSALSPSIYFIGDIQTGFFSPTTGEITFVSVGSSVFNINPSGVNVTGVVTATSFIGDGSGLTGAGSTVFNDTTTNQEYYPLFTDITTGTITASGISTSKLTYNPFNGEMTAINFNSTSDVNLKTNIQTVENALETVNSLRGVSFDWKETGKKSYGVIAQELEEILPELVKNSEIKSVNYDGLIGVLIEAIKELKAEIEEIKNTPTSNI
jgi:hypothetical protein